MLKSIAPAGVPRIKNHHTYQNKDDNAPTSIKIIKQLLLKLIWTKKGAPKKYPFFLIS